MKLIFKWLRPIQSQQATISGCKITSYFLNFQIFFLFSLKTHLQLTLLTTFQNIHFFINSKDKKNVKIEY